MNAMNGAGEKTTWQVFGPWLRRQRDIAGKTRKQVAAAVNIHPGQLARIELGESGTRKDTLDALIVELSLDPKDAYIKAGFWPPEEIQTIAEAEPDDRAAEAARAAEMIENFLSLPPEKQTQVLALIRVVSADHPELLQMLKAPVQVVDASELMESDAIEDTD